MIAAYHIMKLLPTEQAMFFPIVESDVASCLARIQRRWRAVNEQGTLVAGRFRGDAEYSLEKAGRMFREDALAGDDAYVFLSATGRFLISDHTETLYGWVFDAEELAAMPGVLAAAHDLMADYMDIIDDVTARVADRTGADIFDLIDAAMGDTSHSQLPGALAAEVVQAIQRRMQALQAKMRKSGDEALALVRDGRANEILVPRELSLNLAKGTVEAGVSHER